MKLLAFDVETHKITPEGDTDILKYRPLGIACASLYPNVGEPFVFYNGYPDAPLPDAMTKEQVSAMLQYMTGAINKGRTLVTWNGNFDFNVLAEEANASQTITIMALEHIDIMFQLLSLRGFPLSLDTACRGMGVQGKTEGMHGDLAPVMWQKGEYERYQVLEYVKQDTRATLNVAEAIEKKGYLSWIAKSGKYNTCSMKKLLTVSECLALPEPDQSWMSNPLKRAKLVEWMAPDGI